jgi:hypothetical protein
MKLGGLWTRTNGLRALIAFAGPLANFVFVFVFVIFVNIRDVFEILS